MAQTVHKEFPFLKVVWDDSFQGVLMDWKGGFVRGEMIKQGLDEGLAFLISKKATRWLANTKELGVFSAETQKWINENWFPRFLSSQVNAMAVIVPEDALAQMSVQAVMKTTSGSDLKVHYFGSVEEARIWLKGQ